MRSRHISLILLSLFIVSLTFSTGFSQEDQVEAFKITQKTDNTFELVIPEGSEYEGRTLFFPMSQKILMSTLRTLRQLFRFTEEIDGQSYTFDQILGPSKYSPSFPPITSNQRKPLTILIQVDPNSSNLYFGIQSEDENSIIIEKFEVTQ